MPFLYADRVRETSTSVGLGAFSLSGAVSGYQTFSSGIGANNTCHYVIVHRTANEWEVGYGTLDGTATTLTRTTVLASSNANAAVTFSAGTKDVFNSIPAMPLQAFANPNATGSALEAISLLPHGTSSGNTAEIRFLELAANGSNYVGFKAPDSIPSTLIWTLPSSDGTSGQIFRTDGSGSISWSTVLSSGSITSGYIGNAAVVSGNIASGSVGQFSIASGSITAEHIASGAVINADVADNAITSGKIASGTIGTLHVSNGGILSGNIGSGQIGAGHLASGVIAGATLGSGQVTSGNIASGSVGQFALSSGAVNSGHIGNAAVVSGSIASGSIGANHVSSGTLFSLTNPSVNRIVTSLASGTNSATANTNLTYDGTTFTANSVVSGSTVVSVTGQAGQLLAITDVNTGDIYQIGDIGGNPILSVNSSGAVKIVSSGVLLVDTVYSVNGKVNFPAGLSWTSGYINSGGPLISTLGSGIVLSGNLGNASVVSGSIASGQIGVNHLASGIVVSYLTSGIITSGMIGNNAVVSGSIASGSVGQYAIASGVITAEHIASGAVINADIADNAVTSGKIASGSVGQYHHASGSITSGHIGDAAVVSGSIASGAIGQFAIASGVITANHIASGSVINADIADNAVTSGKIASGTIGTLHLASGVVVSYLTSGVITSGMIGNAAVVSGSIASGSIGINHASSGTLFTLTNPAVNRVVTSLASGTNSATANTNLTYDGSTLTATSVTSGNTVLSVTGQAGQLLAVTDNNTGEIYAVGDIGGNPIFAINSSGAVKIVNSGVLLVDTVYSVNGKVNFPTGLSWSSGYINSGGPLISTLGSGIVLSGNLGNASVVSGNIASGQIGTNHLASGVVVSYLTSGIITSGMIGNAAVVSGSIASGTIAGPHLASGVLNSISGNVAITSGSLSVDTVFATSGNTGVGTSLTIKAADAVSSGAGGNIVLQPGAQSVTGGNGYIYVNSVNSGGSARLWSDSSYNLNVMVGQGGAAGALNIYRQFTGTNKWGSLQIYSASYDVNSSFAISANEPIAVYPGVPTTPGQPGNQSDKCFVIVRRGLILSECLLNPPYTDYRVGFKAGLENGVMKICTALNNGVITSGGGSFAHTPTTTTINSDTNNFVVDGSAFQRLNVTSGCTITGISFQSGSNHVDGRFIRLVNIGTQNATLSNQDTNSSGNNRFYTATSGNIVLGPDHWVDCVYDSTTGGWRVYGANYPYVFPIVNGTSGQILTTNANNNLVWANGYSLSSGVVTSGYLGNASVVSGSIASGQIGLYHLASGTVLSGTFVTSGSVQSGSIGNAAVVSGSIASGQIGTNHLASGVVVSYLTSGIITSGMIGNAAVVSGSIASGTIGTNHCSSGTLFTLTNPAVNRVVTSLASGTNSATANTNFTYDGTTLTTTSVTSGSTVLSVTGQAGQLFSVTDNNSGDLYQVGDISGVPIFTVNSNGYVKIISNTFTGQTANFTAFSISDTSGVAAFIEYYAINTATSAYRAGTISAVWNSTADTVSYSETATDDLGGSTIGLSFTAAITSNNFVVTANVTTGTWTVKLGTRVL